ncbi:MAG: ATP-binding protein [Candidatus Sumerlaeaceae bacterium]|nr:ATP-binding protein [Candidatus Sumerlaeaceae bacterium]
MTTRPQPEWTLFHFRAKLFLAFAAGCLLAAFVLFAATNYYVNLLQKRNVEAAIELAREQARHLAREILDLMREERSESLSNANMASRLRPLTQIILRQNQKIVWAGIFDPQTGTYVVEQSKDQEQTFKINQPTGEAYRSQIPNERGQPVEIVLKQSSPATETREVQQVIEHDGKPVGEIRLRIAQSEPFIRIEATSQQITRALTLQVILLLSVFLFVFWMVWRLVRRHVAVLTRNAQLAQMAYVGTLASGLAHEIRNPLNAMSINLQLAQEELAELNGASSSSRQIGELLSRVGGEIHQLNETLTRFLEFALPTRESVTRFSLLELVKDLIEAHRNELESRGVTCVVHAGSPKDSVIEADKRLIFQALRNIFLNAIQAVTNCVRKRIEIDIWCTDKMVCVAVSDSGPGIPQEHLPHIFEAFYTTRKGGSGLGLAIAKKIVEEHGGEIVAESQPGMGARFKLSLPKESPIFAQT